MKLSLNNGNDDFYDGHPSGAAAVPWDGAALSVFAEFYADADAAAALAKEMSFPCVCKKEWTAPFFGCETVQNGCEGTCGYTGWWWCIVENPGCGHQRGDGSVDDSSVDPDDPDGQWAHCNPDLDPLRAAEAAAGTLPVGATHLGVRTVLSGDVLKDVAVHVGMCENTCATANDGLCSDGGPGEETLATCALGTDCEDCGARDISMEMSMEDNVPEEMSVTWMTIDTGFDTFHVSLAARSAGPCRAHTPMPRAHPTRCSQLHPLLRFCADGVPRLHRIWKQGLSAGASVHLHGGCDLPRLLLRTAGGRG